MRAHTLFDCTGWGVGLGEVPLMWQGPGGGEGRGPNPLRP